MDSQRRINTRELNTPEDAFKANVAKVLMEPGQPGQSPKSIGFFTEAQSKQLGDLVVRRVKAGDTLEELEACILGWLESLPPGLLTAHKWEPKELATVLTIAAVLAAICHKHRSQFS